MIPMQTHVRNILRCEYDGSTEEVIPAARRKNVTDADRARIRRIYARLLKAGAPHPMQEAAKLAGFNRNVISKVVNGVSQSART